MQLFLVSRNDPAAVTLSKFFGYPLIWLEDDLIHAKNLPNGLLIFLSRHVSKSQKQSITTHAVGNFGSALLGGTECTLVESMPNLMSNFIDFAKLHSPSNFEVIQEATHHGPSSENPIVFFELGSNELGWQNEIAAKVICDAIKYACTIKIQKPVAIGIGGPHHCPNLTKISKQKGFALSHVCAKYDLKFLNEDLLSQMIEKSSPKATAVILDWKGLGKFKDKIKLLCENKGLEIIRT